MARAQGSDITVRGHRTGWVLLALAIGVFLVHAVYLFNVSEDAFISLRFSQNLARGHGLVWNPGEAPVEGYTNFLWVMLCALAIRLHLDGVAFAVAGGFLASVVTLVVIYRFGRAVMGWDGPLAALPCLLLAAGGPFAYWASSAMELPLFTMLVASGCYFFARHWQRRTPRALAAATVLFVLASLTRPEGIMVTGLVLGTGFLLSAGDPERRSRHYLVAALLFVVATGTYIAWRYSYYGYPLPNTYYAKTGGHLYQYLRGATVSAYFALHFLAPLSPLVLLAAWETAARSSAPSSSARTFLERLRDHGVIVVLITLCVVYSAYIVYVGGDYMAMHRFFVPILPFVYLLFAQVARAPLERASGKAVRRWVCVVCLAVTFGGTFIHSTPLGRAVFAKARLQTGNYEGVAMERWLRYRTSTVGKFFDRYRRDGESLGTGAIGAIGYYAPDLRVYDFYGLVDLHIAHSPAPATMGQGRPGHDRRNVAYIFSLQPTFVMLSNDLTKEPGDTVPLCPADIQPWVAAHYENVSVWLVDEGTGEAGYFTFLQLRGARSNLRTGAAG